MDNFEDQIDENWPVEARYLVKTLIKQYESDLLNERFKREKVEERCLSLTNLLLNLFDSIRLLKSYRKWRKHREFIFENMNYAEKELIKLQNHCKENDQIDYG